MDYVYIYMGIDTYASCIQMHMKHPGSPLRNASGCFGLSHGYVKPTLRTTFAALWQRAN